MRWTPEQLEEHQNQAKSQASKNPCYQPKRGHRSAEKELLGRYLLTGSLMWKPEFRFHPTRQWRFDWCLPELKIAVEFEGGVFTTGGHTRGAHFSSDAEKYSEAAILGWMVIRVTSPMVREGKAFDLIERAMNARKEKF